MTRPDTAHRQELAFGLVTQFVGTTLYGVSSFTLSIVILRETGSLWAYAGNAFSAAAITALFGPVAGMAVDTIGRAKVVGMVALANVALSGLALFAGGFGHAPTFYAFLLTVFCCLLTSCSAVVAVSLPGLLADTPGGVGGRLNSIQISEQVARVVSPLLLLAFYPISFQEIGLVIAVLSLTLLIATLFCARKVKILESRAASPGARDGGARPSLSEMLKYIKKDGVLRILAIYLAISTACVELASTGLAPVVISFSSEALLGLSFAIANVAAVCGSIAAKGLTNHWNKRFALKTFLLIEAAGGILIAVESQTESIVTFTVALASGFFILPASLIAAQVAWLGDAPKGQQGVLSGLERTSSWVLVPFAYLLGPLLVPPAEFGREAFAVDTFRMIVLAAAVVLFVTSALAWGLIVPRASRGDVTD